jgi:hypothetical protein
MKFKLTALLLLALALAACSGKVESSETLGGGGVGVPDDSGNQPKPVVAFDYNRFLYDTSGVCGQQGFYFKLLTADDVVIGQRGGQDVMVDSRVLLYPNKRFEVEINEKYIMSYTDSGYTYKKMKSRVVSGNYSQSNGKLVLGDVMEIVGREVDKRVQANILYKKDVMSAGLAGRSVMGHMVWATSAIKSERETCPNPEDTLGDFAKFQARADRSTIQLSALYSDERFYSNDFYIKNMRLILQNDGSYAIVAEGAAPGVGFVTTYIIDSGYWSRVNGSLKLYNGILNLGFGDDEATLRFTRDLTVFANDKAYSLPMLGKTVSMKFYPSDLITDDLTDTYR